MSYALRHFNIDETLVVQQDADIRSFEWISERLLFQERYQSIRLGRAFSLAGGSSFFWRSLLSPEHMITDTNHTSVRTPYDFRSNEGCKCILLQH